MILVPNISFNSHSCYYGDRFTVKVIIIAFNMLESEMLFTSAPTSTITWLSPVMHFPMLQYLIVDSSSTFLNVLQQLMMIRTSRQFGAKI